MLRLRDDGTCHRRIHSLASWYKPEITYSVTAISSGWRFTRRSGGSNENGPNGGDEINVISRAQLRHGRT